MPDPPPGNGFFGWLGRQVGHVRRAVRANVGEKKIDENRSVEEASLPRDPTVKLRRTTIDEVIVQSRQQPPPT